MLLITIPIVIVTLLSALLLAVCTRMVDRRVTFPGKRSQHFVAVASILLTTGYAFGAGLDHSNVTGASDPNSSLSLCGLVVIISPSSPPAIAYSAVAWLGALITSTFLLSLCSMFADVLTAVERSASHICAFWALSNWRNWKWSALNLISWMLHAGAMRLAVDAITSDLATPNDCLTLRVGLSAPWKIVPSALLFAATMTLLVGCMARASIRVAGYQYAHGRENSEERLRRQKRRVLKVMGGVTLVAMATCIGPILALIYSESNFGAGNVTMLQRNLPI